MKDSPVVSDKSLSVPACPLLTTGTALVVIGSYLSDNGAWHRAITIANRLIEQGLYDWRKQGQITILDPYAADTIEGRELKEGEAYRIEGLPFAAYTNNEREALREYIAAQVAVPSLASDPEAALDVIKALAEKHRAQMADWQKQQEAEAAQKETAHLAVVDEKMNRWLAHLGMKVTAEGGKVRVGEYVLRGEWESGVDSVYADYAYVPRPDALHIMMWCFDVDAMMGKALEDSPFYPPVKYYPIFSMGSRSLNAHRLLEQMAEADVYSAKLRAYFASKEAPQQAEMPASAEPAPALVLEPMGQVVEVPERIEFKTLMQYLDLRHELAESDSNLSDEVNAGWEIYDLSVISAAGQIRRVVTLKRTVKALGVLEAEAAEAMAEAEQNVLRPYDASIDSPSDGASDARLQDEDVTEEDEPEAEPEPVAARQRGKMTAEQFAQRYPYMASVWRHGADAVNDAISQRTMEAARKAYEAEIAQWSDDGLDDELPLLTSAIPANPYRAEVQS